MRFRAVVVPLLEVVLHTPAETVLAPYIERAPSPETKKWFATNFKNWLLKSPENLHQLTYLPPNSTPQQEKAFSFKDLWDIRLSPATETMIEHLFDYFQVKPNPPRLERMSVPDVVKAADDEIRAYNARVAKQGEADDPKGVVTVMEFPGGYRIVEMTSQKALDREGNLMGHCIGSLHGCYIKDKTRRMFSLRDANNEPHASIEVRVDNMRTTEIKGRRNMAPARRYWPMLRQFIEQYGVTVDNDHRNIGLLQIEDPETGQFETMTSDQFRDMVLDPNSERGQSFLNNMNPRYMEPDTALGLFNALYGTDRLTDPVIEMVFSGSADHAVQVVEHYGNKFTPEQLVTAFTAMRSMHGIEIGGLYKAMLIATKPDAATVNAIIEAMTGAGDHVDRSGRLRRRSAHAEEFVVAVSQQMPEVYREIISDPEAMERELETNNARAAGPFFALAGTDELTTPMIQQAFHYLPDDALKRLRRNKIVPDHEQFAAIMKGASSRYWGRDEAGAMGKFLEPLLEYVHPDRTMMSSGFEHTSDRNFAARLLMAAKKLVPESIDKDVAEQAVIAIDKDELFADFLKDETDPSERIQQLMWQKASKEGGNNPKYLQYLPKIGPAIWQNILKSLTPEPIPTIKQDHKSVKDKKTDKWRQIQVKRALNDDEKAKARQNAREEARGRFLKLLAPAVTEPGVSADSPISPEGVKYQEGKAAFEALGKGMLFDNAIQRLNRRHLASRIAPGNGYGRSNVDVAMFKQHVDELTAKQIVSMIERNNDHLFGALVDAAPYRVPEIISYNSGQYRRDNYGHYGKFDYPVDKEKALESLEAVWASTRVPEQIKDDYSVKVLKRFKPKPADLLRMLTTANSFDATRYILKKTKKPALPLLRLVLEKWPGLMTEVPLAAISDDLLTDIMRENWPLARRLMDRDLRDFGTDSRSKWARPDYRGDIGSQKESAAYERYAQLAKTADKEAAFARYVKQAELEDLHPQLSTYDEKAQQNRVNMPLLRQHLDDYSIRSLVQVARESPDDAVMKLYFEHFPVKKLVTLTKAGVFQRYEWSHEAKENITKDLDPHKLREVVMMALEDPNGATNLGLLLKQMMKDGFKFDDEMSLAILQSDKTGQFDTDSLIRRSKSPKVLHWVADHKPRDLEDIRHPDAYVVRKLFDHFGKIERNRAGDVKLNYSFTQTVTRWFSSDSLFFKYKPNPEVAKLLMAEAIRRRGTALVITRTILQHVDQLRKRAESGESYVSTSGSVPVQMLPRGAKVEKE